MSDFNFQFRDGDKVWDVGGSTTKILTVKHIPDPVYPIWCDGGYFTADGKSQASAISPTLFPATQEWYDKLVHVYPNLEKPTGKKTPKEIIQAMMNFGYDGVPCKTECGSDRYICIGIVEGEFYSFQYDNDDDNAYSSGIPYHPKTGLKIVDFIDGKCVLENGEVVLED